MMTKTEDMVSEQWTSLTTLRKLTWEDQAALYRSGRTRQRFKHYTSQYYASFVELVMTSRWHAVGSDG